MGSHSGGGCCCPFRHDVWVLKALTEAGDQAPAELRAQTPDWFIYITAARTLGCSAVELMEHPEADYWMRAADAHALFESWLRERAERDSRR